MAKTIEQLAEEHYNGITSSNQDFIDGANKVLDEIDEICCQSDKTYEERYLMITDLIKRLKGK